MLYCIIDIHTDSNLDNSLNFVDVNGIAVDEVKSITAYSKSNFTQHVICIYRDNMLTRTDS